MNALSVFAYSDKQIRGLNIDGEPWVVAKDVCDVLELTTPAKAMERLDADEKGMTSIHTLGGIQEMTIVNEAGLYTLILGSRKKEAKEFKRWVTHEVIPAIRKTGAYGIKPMTQAEILAAQAQYLVDMERKVGEVDTKVVAVEQKLDNALSALAAPIQAAWKQATNDEIRHFCKQNGLNYMMFWNEIYDELENTAHVNIRTRRNHLRSRMLKGGAKYVECQTVSKLDVVDRDPKLKSIFDGILRRKKAQAATA